MAEVFSWVRSHVLAPTVVLARPKSPGYRPGYRPSDAGRGVSDRGRPERKGAGCGAGGWITTAAIAHFEYVSSPTEARAFMTSLPSRRCYATILRPCGTKCRLSGARNRRDEFSLYQTTVPRHHGRAFGAALLPISRRRSVEFPSST